MHRPVGRDIITDRNFLPQSKIARILGLYDNFAAPCGSADLVFQCDIDGLSLMFS